MLIFATTLLRSLIELFAEILKLRFFDFKDGNATLFIFQLEVGVRCYEAFGLTFAREDEVRSCRARRVRRLACSVYEIGVKKRGKGEGAEKLGRLHGVGQVATDKLGRFVQGRLF